MLKILFQNGVSTDASFHLLSNGVVELIGENVNNLSGFMVAKDNGRVIGDYSNYTTKYNIYTEIENGIRLSTGEVEPEPIPEPEPPAPKTTAIVRFELFGEGELEGDTEYEVPIGTPASEIAVPGVKTGIKYEFMGWNPVIEGVIENDITFVATTQLKKEYTIDARLDVVEGSIMELAEIVYS